MITCPVAFDLVIRDRWRGLAIAGDTAPKSSQILTERTVPNAGITFIAMDTTAFVFCRIALERTSDDFRITTIYMHPTASPVVGAVGGPTAYGKTIEDSVCISVGCRHNMVAIVNSVWISQIVTEIGHIGIITIEISTENSLI